MERGILKLCSPKSTDKPRMPGIVDHLRVCTVARPTPRCFAEAWCFLTRSLVAWYFAVSFA